MASTPVYRVPLPPASVNGDGSFYLSPGHVIYSAGDSVLISKSQPSLKTDLPEAPTKWNLEQKAMCGTMTGPLLAFATDNQVLLFHWDGLLDVWERFIISEGEGRISSLAVTIEGSKIYVTAFKWDSVIIYMCGVARAVEEVGPLLLDTILCVASLEKGKEQVAFAHTFIQEETLIAISISATASVKMWEVDLRHTEKWRLLKHQSAGTVKTPVASDCSKEFLLLVGSEGSMEVFLISSSGFNLLNRLNGLKNTEDCEVADDENRIVSARFFIQDLTTIEDTSEDKENAEYLKENGFDKALHTKIDKCLLPAVSPTFPQLLIVVVTPRRVSVLNAKSGHFIYHVNYNKIFSGEDLLVQDAMLTLEKDTCHIVIQPVMHPFAYATKFSLSEEGKDVEANGCSLHSCEAIVQKSVLRKKFKSPPRVEPPKAKKKSIRGIIGKKGMLRSPPVFIAGKVARSRPSPSKRPLTARSRSRARSPCHSDNSISNGDIFSARPVRIPARGTYDNETLEWKHRSGLSSGLMGGHSYLRLTPAPNGNVIAAGGSISPVAVVRTGVWETIRLLKDVSKVTALHFNFHSNLLLIGTNGGKTRIMSWQKDRELLSWDFQSKFNEHVHTQFYFMDKFVLQPQCNFINLYAIKEAGNETALGGTSQFIRLQAASFPFSSQSVTAVGAANLFLSSKIVAGLSNKGLEVMDANNEKVVLSVKNAHSKAITCIRINEAPKGPSPSSLVDVILTAAPSSVDPVKLWDLRSAQCVLKFSDVGISGNYVSCSRPALSPCGRFIATGMEDNSLVMYDTRKMDSRLKTFTALRSTVLDCCFDVGTKPIVWAGCRDGSFWSFYN